MRTIQFYRFSFILFTSGICLKIVISMEPDPLADSETDPNHVPAPTDYDFVDDDQPPREQNKLFREEHISVIPEQIINNQNENKIPAVSEEPAVLRCEENCDELHAPEIQTTENQQQFDTISPCSPTPTTDSGKPPSGEPEEIILRCKDNDELETTEEIKTTEVPEATEKQQISDIAAGNKHEEVILRCIDEEVSQTQPPPTERNDADQQSEFYPRPCSVQLQQMFPAPATYAQPSTIDVYRPEIRAQRNNARVSVSQLFTINQDCYPNCVSSSNFILSPPPSLPSQSEPCYSATEECKLKRLKRFIFNL
ncbi:hypothetical protein T4B_10297 [Trichinella pseudospiralis]|uniref:Uncharacterized protein n=2 Tax=Trichinella pseudospiralis TaxID=6337 RepID=A0A0V1IRU2_TRIPS|nr:hypothetical protein T4B_10297 [Trichinella pseudospiralis]